MNTVAPSDGPDGSCASSPRLRLAAAVVAIVAWTGVLAGCVGVYGRKGSIDATLWIMSGYFTNTTGLLIAILFSGIALGVASFAKPSLLAAATLMILLVAIVQRALLHGLLILHGADAFADVLLHIVLPVLVPLFWLAFATKGTLRWRDPVLWALYPLAYLAWALARGLAGGRYAYPFIDPSRGWLPVLAHVAAITAGFLVLGWLYVALDARLALARGARQTAA